MEHSTKVLSYLLFDHTGPVLTCDGCARDPYFYVPAETQSLHINIFAQKNTPFDRPGCEPMTLRSLGRNSNHWTTEADLNKYPEIKMFEIVYELLLLCKHLQKNIL